MHTNKRLRLGAINSRLKAIILTVVVVKYTFII